MGKKYLFPTETAFVVTDFLEKYFTRLMEYKFTKIVEEDFDKVANKEEKFQDMLKNFWENSLKKDLENA
jgi:DNA topoisomerase-1